jgi:uncharacterized protein YlaN (UPF0358 family)
MEEFVYKGIRGKDGIRAFEEQKDKSITQIENIVDFVIRNKEVVPEWNKKELVNFIERQLIKLDEYGIKSD